MGRDSFLSISGIYIVKFFVSGRFKGRDLFFYFFSIVCVQNKVFEWGYYLKNIVYYRYYFSFSKSIEFIIYKIVIVQVQGYYI